MTSPAAAGQPRRLPGGPWRVLLAHALCLIDELRAHGLRDPFWTLGGGTVLMFRYRHRRSKDIDIFVPDPQYLGHVTPRLSDVADSIATDYVEGAGYVKLLRPEGEIDFVAAPNLTDTAYDTWRLLKRPVRVETATEIIAKKLWHRGSTPSARDVFDLSLVIEREPAPLRQAHAFLTRHRQTFLAQLESRAAVLRAQFDAIDALEYRPTFDEAVERVSRFPQSLPPRVRPTRR